MKEADVKQREEEKKNKGIEDMTGEIKKNLSRILFCEMKPFGRTTFTREVADGSHLNWLEKRKRGE